MACTRREEVPSSPLNRAPTVPTTVATQSTALQRPARHVLDTWSLGGDREVAVSYPAPPSGETRYPVLIALHGRGEARKAPKDGAMGWFRDYELSRALERVDAPPLTTDDFHGFVEPARLAEINVDLKQAPYRGLVVVCPYLPDIDLQKPSQASAYGRYLVTTLLPAIHARTPSLQGAEATAIDGVSLGGATALQVGFEHPKVFGSVGGIQAAIQSVDVPLWADRAQQSRMQNPKQTLRLLTSKKDYFRDGIGALSTMLKRRGLEHTYLDVPGPHDYIFNQGPGAYELLYFHERVLKRS